MSVMIQSGKQVQAIMSKRVQMAALAVTLGMVLSAGILPETVDRASGFLENAGAEQTTATEDGEWTDPFGFIAIDESAFPDEAFREYVKTFDLNNDGKLYQSELDNVTEIDVDGLGIESLQGIEYFTSLSSLKCAKNSLTSLDLSENKKLAYLYCQSNQLASLNIEKNTGLTILYCGDNQLTSLDVSHTSALKYLSCQRNQIASLDLEFAKNLVNLQCFENRIAALNVSRSFDLAVLKCYANQITDLKIGSSSKLSKIVRNLPPKEKKIDDYSVYYYEQNDMQLYYDKSVTEVQLSGTSFADFIERLYVVALNRASDESGKEYWMNRVQNEGFTGGDCARYFLIDAGEFANRGLNNDQFVDILYKTFFDRESEQGGKDFWMNKLNEGASRNSVVNGFINSTEWCNLCAVYGVKPGASGYSADKPSRSAERFATRLYEQCLERAPEAGGLRFWSLKLTNHTVSGSAAAREFFMSKEFVAKNLTDEEFVTRVYRTYMGREPEIAGLVYWTGRLSGGLSREAVLNEFAVSKEFTNICKDYGIDRI